MNGLPEQMALWAERKNIRATRRGIAEAANVGTSTISRLVDGGNTSHETVVKVATALDVTTAQVYQASGLSDGVRKPWLPPLRESFFIHGEVARALDTLIRALARTQEGGGDPAAPTNETGGPVSGSDMAKSGQSDGSPESAEAGSKDVPTRKSRRSHGRFMSPATKASRANNSPEDPPEI